MRLSFEETMQGTLRDLSHREHPVSFSVEMEGEGKGLFTMRGTVKAPPWAEAMKATGAFTLSARRIHYHLRFGPFVLEGTKTPSLLKPIFSMTKMPVTLRERDSVVAEGEMYFDLKDLPGFLLSWVA
jgi:hypothetical protein